MSNAIIRTDSILNKMDGSVGSLSLNNSQTHSK